MYFFLWVSILSIVGWAVSGARCSRARRWAGAVLSTAVVVAWSLSDLVEPPYRFATNAILSVLVVGVVVAVGNHVRKRAMQAVIDGVEEDG